MLSAPRNDALSLAVDDLPARTVCDIEGSIEVLGATPQYTIHVPDLGGPAHAVVPEDVWVTVLVEVVCFGDAPSSAVGDSEGSIEVLEATSLYAIRNRSRAYAAMAGVAS